MLPPLPPSRLPLEPTPPDSDREGEDSSESSSVAKSSAFGGRKITLKRLLIELVIVFGLAVPLALGLHTFVTQVYAISGSSMEPTLHDGERVVIDKLGPALTDLEWGDMVIFTSPIDSSRNLVKRIIGVAGDRIVLRGDRVYRNGEPLNEKYALRGLYHEDDEFTVPPGHIFVLGDNRPQSKDSRHFGAVEADRVRGRVLLRLWPLDAITAF